jgi:hypothetical protein
MGFPLRVGGKRPTAAPSGFFIRDDYPREKQCNPPDVPLSHSSLAATQKTGSKSAASPHRFRASSGPAAPSEQGREPPFLHRLRQIRYLAEAVGDCLN